MERIAGSAASGHKLVNPADTVAKVYQKSRRFGSWTRISALATLQLPIHNEQIQGVAGRTRNEVYFVENRAKRPLWGRFHDMINQPTGRSSMVRRFASAIVVA